MNDQYQRSPSADAPPLRRYDYSSSAKTPCLPISLEVKGIYVERYGLLGLHLYRMDSAKNCTSMTTTLLVQEGHERQGKLSMRSEQATVKPR